MSEHSAHASWVIVVSVLVALLLSIVPLPFWAQWGRPEWVAMVIVYWVIALPERVGVGMAWLAGIALDLVDGAPLGQNAIALALIAYISQVLYQRLRMYTPWQQSGVLFLLVGVYQLVAHWIQALTGTVSPNLMFLLPSLVSALLWPWLSVILRFLRRYFYVQ